MAVGCDARLRGWVEMAVYVQMCGRVFERARDYGCARW